MKADLTSTSAPVVDPALSGIIDCDVHQLAPDRELRRYLPERWRRYHERYGLTARNSHARHFDPRPRKAGARADAWPPGGALPGSDFAFMREQLLDRWDMSAAILNSIDMAYIGAEGADYSHAITAALNDWTLHEWVERDDRFYASICVSPEFPDRAIAEMERFAAHPRFVQVLGNTATRDPLGSEKYWPIYEAASALGLPVAFHVGGAATSPITGSGWPVFYFELHAGWTVATQSQVASLICEGVVARFPKCRFVMQEGGFSWVPSLGWRLDAAWELFGEDIPALAKAPSEYLRDNFWYTTQPLEGPDDPAGLVKLLEDPAYRDHLLYASDYPHWDFDSPDLLLPKGMEIKVAQGILGGNARSLYGKLPSTDAGA
jgi:predicted TIM-barrel fold metal-dependent hydrolase